MPINVSALDFTPTTIPAAGALGIAARYYSQLSVETDAACTATVIRIDSDPTVPGATPAAPGAPVVSAVNQYTVAPSTLSTIVIDWPFYLIQAVAGTCRVALV